ncbi:MAG: signal peptide peptidase SppA [Myxococcota bacterium]
MLARISTLLALACLMSACLDLDLAGFGRPRPLVETTVLGERGPKLAMVDISGVISENTPRGILGLQSGPGQIARLREALDLAADDPEVAALLLRIRTPGGTVSATETIHHELLRWKAETGRPVIAFLNGLATSGGYYIAMAADEVVAHPTVITGSIGVIMVGLNFSGLMERFGIADQSVKSGPYKDAGSPLRKMTPEETAQLQGVVDDLHARFIEIVDSGRPALERAAVLELADGRIYTSRQALDLGLIDRIGYLEDAAKAAESRSGISESRVVTYHPPGAYKHNIYNGSDLPPVQVIDLHLLPAGESSLQPGFYYLWPFGR